jgi:hypothetical protein
LGFLQTEWQGKRLLIMQELEPFYRWRDLYLAEEDSRSPFYGVKHDNFEYSTTVYNYYLHPEWDDMGSKTLYLKILFADYRKKYVIIEMIGEWNDAIENDIMIFRREVIDPLFDMGICKFILVAENVLNFHSSDKEYYEEWYENVSDENGWIVCLNMPESSQYDFKKMKLNYFIELRNMPDWRRYQPDGVFTIIDTELKKRIKL